MKRRSLAPGFRFNPTHVELVMFYLKRKVMRRKLPMGVISELDIYKYAPWDLPDKSCLKSGDLKWYFFCPRERKYASGARINRVTNFGYWKSTGKDKSVDYNNEVVGQRKTLTFFRGKAPAPKGDQTNWTMHEYRIEEKNLSLKNVAQDAYVLCVVFKKDGPGPRNGAEYGAPYKEEEWDDDDLEVVDLSAEPSVQARMLPSKEPQKAFAPDTTTTPSKLLGCSSASCISDNLAPTSKEIPQFASGSIAQEEIPQNPDNVDDGFTIQDIFPEDGNLNLNDGDEFQAMQNDVHGTVSTLNNTDQNDIYKDLKDLLCLFPGSNGDGNAYVPGYRPIYSPDRMFSMSEMFSSDQMPYLELNDLEVPLSFTSEAVEYPDMQMLDFNAADNRCSVTRQPHVPFVPFGAANQHVPSCQYPSLHNSNDQIWHPTDLGFPDTHMSAPSQSACLQGNTHHSSNEGCNGYNLPGRHDSNR